MCEGIQGHPMRRFFSNHQSRAVGVAAGNGGHDACVDHTQTSDAAHLQLAVDDGHVVVVFAHAGGADGVKNGAGNVACQLGQIFIGLVLNTGLELFRLERRHGRLRHDAARHAQAVCRHFAVFVGAEVVGRNGGRVFEVGAL